MTELDRDTLLGVAVILVLIASWSIGNMLYIAQESSPDTGEAGLGGEADTDATFLSITFQNWVVISFLTFVAFLYFAAYRYGDRDLLSIYGKIMGIIILVEILIVLNMTTAVSNSAYMKILVGALALVGVFYLLYLRGVSLKWRAVGSVITLALLFLAFNLVENVFPAPEEPTGGTGSPFSGGETAFNFMEQHTGVVLLPILIIALVLLFFYSDIKRLFRPQKVEEKEVEEEFSKTVKDAIEDLYKGKDVRSTIIRCYQKMCLILEDSGITNEDFITPREFENKALDKLDVSERTIKDLTGTFEEARYSNHHLGEEKRKRALRDLHNLQEGLSD